jgi:diadenosine tetraphosphate (Ap4A) HIT family hydrolase
MTERVPFDVAAYERRVRAGGCFICGFLAGEPGMEHELLYDDGLHVAFLSRYPTVRGYALVVPRRHVEDVVRDLTSDEYLAFQTVVYRIARAINEVVPTERTYLCPVAGKHAGQLPRPLAQRTPTARSSLPTTAISRIDGRERRHPTECHRDR